MASIAESIGRIVEKKINGELLKAAKNGPEITAKVGVGKGLTGSEDGGWPDEEFVEQSRTEVVQRVTSTDDPELWVDDPVVTVVKFKSKEGRAMNLILKEPTPDA